MDYQLQKKGILSLNLFGHENYCPNGSWSVRPWGRYIIKYDEHINDISLQKFLLESVNTTSCGTCKGDWCVNFEKRVYHTFLFGNELKGLCSGVPIKIINPSGDALSHTKELVLITRDIIEVKI